MPSRRPHTKSRRGCIECKAHKVKCDESRPSCARCSKRNDVCHYRENQSGCPPSSLPHSYESPLLGHSQAAAERLNDSRLSARTLNHSIVFPRTSDAPSAAAEVRGDRRRTERFPTEDVELLHHYTTSTYLSLSSDDSHERIWQILVPQEAFSRPFLLHGLLAIAAFHLAHLQPAAPQKYGNLALHHYTTAVALFRLELDDLNPENAPSVFIFANLVVCMSFAIWHAPYPEAEVVLPSGAAGSLQSILDLFSLGRGVQGVLRVSWEWVQDSPFAALTAVDTTLEDNPLSPEGDLAFRSLEAHVDAQAESETAKIGYLDAMRLIKVCHPRANKAVQATPLIMSWPVLISADTFVAWNERKQLALAILGYYGPMLHFLRDTWWIGDIGQRLVAAVCEQLTSEWKPVMVWPRLEVGLDEKITP